MEGDDTFTFAEATAIRARFAHSDEIFYCRKVNLSILLPSNQRQPIFVYLTPYVFNAKVTHLLAHRKMAPRSDLKHAGCKHPVAVYRPAKRFQQRLSDTHRSIAPQISHRPRHSINNFHPRRMNWASLAPVSKPARIAAKRRSPIWPVARVKPEIIAVGT